MKASQVRQALDIFIDADQPVLIHGSPGVGKSDVVRQAAADRGWRIVDMRLSQMDSVDLRGIPYREDGLTQWATNSQLPTDAKKHGERGILFFDEITSAPKSMQAPAYQIVLDRRIGEVAILPGWAIVAAGNKISDRAIVEPMSTALKNRFAHLDYETDNEDWCAWAITRGDISNEVLGFIRFRPNLLNDFEHAMLQSKGEKGADKSKQTKFNDMLAFATPRTWAMVDKLVKRGPPSDIEYDMYSSIVGEGPASEFLAYLKYHRTLPNLDNVLMNPTTAEVPTEPAVLYALATGLASKATPENFDRVVKYLNRIQPEFQVLTIKDSAMRNNALCNTKAFNEWSIKNQNILV